MTGGSGGEGRGGEGERKKHVERGLDKEEWEPGIIKTITTGAGGLVAMWLGMKLGIEI